MAETALELAGAGAHRAEPAAPAVAPTAAAFLLDAGERKQNNRHGEPANNPGAPMVEPVAVRAGRRPNLREAAQGLLDVWDTMPHGDPNLAGAMNGAVAALRAAMGRGRETAAAIGPERPRRDTKQAQVLALLHRDAGASGPQIAEATGWAAHSVRGFLAGLAKKGIAVEVLERVRQVGPNKAGAKGSYTIYRVTGPAKG